MMGWRLRRTAAICFALLCPAITRVAAQSPAGSLRGTVRDAQRQPLSDVRVAVVDEASGWQVVVETGESGSYEVANLKAGTYHVEAAGDGFRTAVRQGVTLSAGETARVDFALELGAASETVTVTAPLAGLQLESPSIQEGLDASELQTLPRNSRDARSFLYLNPNVVGDPDNGFQFLGGRTYGVSYVQDGQPSTGAIFGNVSNSVPGLDAISEVKVLSNAYGAEFGGLGAVVVTSARGGSKFSGTGFYDGNSDELNALTYTQTVAGLQRGFPGSDTHDHQYGLTIGGPLRGTRTFFLLNAEGLNRASVGGGSIVQVPTDRMRAGDFSANSFVVRDPATGLPFTGNIVPANRISASARNVLDFFYPHANLTPLSNGIGRNQQFVNLSMASQLWDARIDHQLSARDALFGRVGWRNRDPGTTFENSSFPNLGVMDRVLRARSVTATWTRTVSSLIVNETHGGWVSDRSNRRSQYAASDVIAALGLAGPAGAAGRRGYPAFVFQGSDAIRGIADDSTDANRDTESATFSLSDTLSWVRGRHALKFGGQYVRNLVSDGFSLGVGGAAGSYVFSGAVTGNSFADFLLGLPSRTDEGVNTRGTSPLDASSNGFAVFAQDDWKVSSALTLFAGLRYEVTGNFVERNNLLVNFDPKTGALVLPDASIIGSLSAEARNLPLELAPAVNVGRALVRNDVDNFSPRAGFAYRPGSGDKTVIRGGFGYYYPTAAAQGIRDALSRSPFRYAVRRTVPVFTNAFATGTPANRSLFGVNAVDMGLESPEVLQYNLTIEHELGTGSALRVSFLGSQSRKLIVNRDLNTVRPSSVPLDLDNPLDRLRLPYPNLDPSLNMVENAGRGYFRALQIEWRRRPLRGLAFGAAYTLADSETTAPDLGNSSLGVVQYAPYNLELDRGPDPSVVRHRFVFDGTWGLPIGAGREHLSALPRWGDAMANGWTLSAIVQARSGQHFTPFFRYGTDPIFPANTGKAYDTINSFDEAWRPDLVGNPSGARTPTSFFNLGAFKLPAQGTIGNAPKGLLEGPGTWVANLGIYKTVLRSSRVQVEFRATLDNAFNTPQFLVTNDSGFLDLTDWLIDGVRDNGVTNVLTDTGSLEGFAAARVIRLGLRVRF